MGVIVKWLAFLCALFVFLTASCAGEKTFTFSGSWGGKGSGKGELNEPYDIEADAEGYLYVTDARNARVQKFTQEGRFILEFGKKGKGPGEFMKPVGVAVDGEGFVYVTDYDLDRIQKFTPSGKFIQVWGSHGRGPGEFDAPSDIAAGPDGSLFVIDLYNHRVQAFDGEGRFLRGWGRKGKVNNLWSVLSVITGPGREGEFYYPAKLVFGNGRVYVSDSYNNRIQVFTPQGKFLFQFGGMGFWKGSFRVASGVTVGPDGLVYAADYYNDRVQVFGPEGNFISSFGWEGAGKGEFKGPTGVTIGKGKIYVVDWGNHRVQEFVTK